MPILMGAAAVLLHCQRPKIDVPNKAGGNGQDRKAGAFSTKDDWTEATEIACITSLFWAFC